MIGIYRIRNLINGHCYYGSSKDIEKRWKKHKNQLIQNKHINILLYRAWNKYGEDNFIFEVVEECDISILLETEQKYLNLLPEYNIGLSASGGDNLTNNPNREDILERIKQKNKKRLDLMTDSEKKAMYAYPGENNPNWKGGSSFKYCECGAKIAPVNKTCIKCKDMNGSNNPFYGKKHTDKIKKKLSEKRKGKKPSNITPVMIDNIIYESLAEASRQTGVPSPTILWRIKSKNTKYLNYQSHPAIKAPLSN
jgi:group I intron endonuclease